MSISATQLISPEEERLRAPRPVSRVILTPEGERMLRAELGRLRQRLDGEFAERLREAHGSGASSENDEYLQIKEEEAVLASRIRQLESLLDSAEIMDEETSGRGIVAIGSLVEVKNQASGAVRKHRITGGFEPAEAGDVSANSPVGQALLGRAPEESVEVELPNGRTVTLEIVAVEPAASTARPGPA
ncbi:MAG: GreA/GreB family elongation factor [Actinobacteria bacterium]|nr:GreA/GreB family elongation factor [Actinomycetota bacterium]